MFLGVTNRVVKILDRPIVLRGHVPSLQGCHLQNNPWLWANPIERCSSFHKSSSFMFRGDFGIGTPINTFNIRFSCGYQISILLPIEGDLKIKSVSG